MCSSLCFCLRTCLHICKDSFLGQMLGKPRACYLANTLIQKVETFPFQDGLGLPSCICILIVECKF